MPACISNFSFVMVFEEKAVVPFGAVLIKCSLTSIANFVSGFEVNPLRRLQLFNSDPLFLTVVFQNKSLAND